MQQIALYHQTIMADLLPFGVPFLELLWMDYWPTHWSSQSDWMGRICDKKFYLWFCEQLILLLAPDPVVAKNAFRTTDANFQVLHINFGADESAWCWLDGDATPCFSRVELQFFSFQTGKKWREILSPHWVDVKQSAQTALSTWVDTSTNIYLRDHHRREAIGDGSF